MKQISLIQRYQQGANWLLVIYLVFAISGCSFRPAEITPEAARILQTRELNVNPEEIARAVIVVLQEMHYTLGTVDMGLGIITAERTSERRLAPLSREEVSETEISDEVQTFCLVAGTAAVIGIFLAWIFGDPDEDRYHRSHPHHPAPIFVGSNDYEPDSYRYTMTVTLEDIMSQQTRVRVTVQGQHLEGSGVTESGPVQSQEFYTDFFSRLQLALNR
jgi:hypothetical protein